MNNPTPPPPPFSKGALGELFRGAVYVISDHPEVLLRAVEDGATLLQLRDKSGDAAQIKAKASAILAHPKRSEFLFILNDDPQLALEIGADGVHIGQDTDSVQTRAVVGASFIIGKTTHNLDQARQAERDGVDYLSAGPVYPTPTKPGRPAVGLEYVREVAENLATPFVAIGGIDETNIDAVLGAGARTVGIVRAAALAPLFLNKVKQIPCN
ncbi:MAG: thiamine phosphate synthase [Verrucomicrobia bacterium]|nr:thiamine phosphate synthase [Verrucomicrobiota bacterium]